MPDFRGIDVAAVGVDLVEPTAREAAALPDVSALTVAPPGSDVLKPDEIKPPPPPPETGDLSLEPIKPKFAQKE
jgi:hypothetical protein